VVLDLCQGRYLAQPVVLGVESGDRIAIRDGIAPGDRIVTSAQFLIDSESNIESALGRLDPSSGGEDDEAPGQSMHEMDHSMHPMNDDKKEMYHSMHDMDGDDQEMDHSMHDMGSGQ
jgi:Cu(I)/Ag(I) efflux system membrane fusion protein